MSDTKNKNNDIKIDTHSVANGGFPPLYILNISDKTMIKKEKRTHNISGVSMEEILRKIAKK